MEYLNSISDTLKNINETGIKWVNILERPDLLRGTVGIAQDRVDFTKFSVEARKEIELYEQSAVKEMNNLYRNTSGCRIMAGTNSSRLLIKAQLHRKWGYRKMNMWCSSGFDVYDIVSGAYVHNTVFGPFEGSSILAEQIKIRENIPLCIYLPLYNCIEALYLGIDENSVIEPFTNNEEILPVIFYGHSVTQGAAASRSGNCFPNIVQRMLNREIINLSCSSCCRGLESMAKEIGKLNCHSIVIDYTRNAESVDVFQNSHEKFYKQVRKYHRDKNIILMTSCNFNNWKDYFEFDKIVRTTYQNALDRGENVKLLDVRGLFREEEYNLVAVDGSHLNDMGMYRVANALVQLIKD